MAFKLGGDYFSPAAGRYVGQFTGTADGPVQDYPATADKPARKGNTIRWFFNLFNLDGSPVIDPAKPGTVAVAEGLSSDTIGVGRGTEAKARVWFRKMLESKGMEWRDPTTQAELDAIIEACKGTFIYITFGPKKVGAGTQISELERLSPQPGAPVAAPAVAFAAVVTAPAVLQEQVAVPVAVAAPVVVPLPVPAAPAFAPTPLPAAPAPIPAGIPAMPFPAAV